MFVKDWDDKLQKHKENYQRMQDQENEKKT